MHFSVRHGDLHHLLMNTVLAFLFSPVSLGQASGALHVCESVPCACCVSGPPFL